MFARSSEQRRLTIAALRSSVHALAAPPLTPSRPADAQGSTEPLASGWSSLDQLLPYGGLVERSISRIDAPPGHGGIALASSWARSASLKGVTTLIVDATPEALPHPWIEPPEAQAPIWVALPSTPGEVWPTVDLGIRSKAFGLVVMTAAPRGSASLRSRLRRLIQACPARLLCLFSPPYTPDLNIEIRSPALRWEQSCRGDAPLSRRFQVRSASLQAPWSPWAEVGDEVLLPRRMSASKRIADRSTSQPSSNSRR